MKTLYYLSFALCLIQLLFFLVMPFAGPWLIVDTIRDGLLAAGEPEYIATLSVYFGISIHAFNVLNKFVTIIYFSSILLGSLTPFFDKMKMRNKFRISLYSFIISLVILFTIKVLGQFF